MANRKQLPTFFREKVCLILFCLTVIDNTAARHLIQNEDNKASDPHIVEDVTFPTFTHLGQISGVAFDNDGKLHIFHRSERVWDENSFGKDNRVTDETVIPNNTIVVIDPISGEELYSWGSNLFYMPHGIFVDHEGNTWITDVGLHQVLKFPPHESKPTLAIGKKLKPGSGKTHLCMPTDVVATNSGYIFISDGYCNSRVLVLDRRGTFLQEIGSDDGMIIPHSLALIRNSEVICVADRENRRVLCYTSGLDGKTPANILLGEIQEPTLTPIYAIRNKGDKLIAIAGRDYSNLSKVPHGVIIDLTSNTHTSTFEPVEGFIYPHDASISKNGDMVFVGELDMGAPRRLYKFNVHD